MDAVSRAGVAAPARARPPASGHSGACASTRCRRRRSSSHPGRSGSRSRGPPGRREDRAAGLDACPTVRPQRVNLLIPTIDLEHFFGGYIGKFNLARRLAERGRPGADRDRRSGRRAAAGLAATDRGLQRASRTCSTRSRSYSAGRPPTIEISRADAFIATTWWTAHIAHEALRSVDAERFLYLIQEYEPFTFPMGTYAALAEQSYRFPHHALFSSELLRELLPRPPDRRLRGRGRGRGHATPRRSRTRSRRSTRRRPPSWPRVRTRRLLFYARPGASRRPEHVRARGARARTRARAKGCFATAGSSTGSAPSGVGERLALSGGAHLNLLPRSDQAPYARLLRDHDVGLALMYTPHPSLVPLEMASAGLLTVTNTFENKTPATLAAISHEPDRGRALHRRRECRAHGRGRGRR